VILAAGLSPAWQQILVFDRFTRGEVNRAVETCACASGKVINVCLALTSLGAESRTLSVLGGRAGAMIEAELAALGASAHWIYDPATTRTCTTIIERSTGEITELVENAPMIEARSCEVFLSSLQEEAQEAQWVILSGSLPPIEGRPSPRSLYREMLDRLPSTARVILDARGPEMLECLSLRPFLVKPNREELALTVGRDLTDPESLITAMREINALGARWVLVTHGAGEVWLRSTTELWRFTPPKIEVVNAIGCGDCLTAGLTAWLNEGHDLPTAVRFGIAAAAHNAVQLLPARLSPSRVRAIAARVCSAQVE
jgi:tagatose 6-phosphate kinase